MGSFIDLTGKKFNRLTVIERTENTSRGQTQWLCRCDCGNMVVVIGAHLKDGHTKSCGCYDREVARKRMTKHGRSGTRLHSVWVGMKRRCRNKNDKSYSNYGGRGISVCDEWMSYDVFLEFANKTGYKEGLTLDRINNDGNYEPSNCRWITRKAQNNNRRSNVIIKIGGESHTLTEWAEISGINFGTLNSRRKRGWHPEYLLLPVNSVSRSTISSFRKKSAI